MTRAGRGGLWVAAVLVAALLWPAAQGALVLLNGSSEAAVAAPVRYHTVAGVLVETRRLEAVQCRYVYRSGPRKGQRCGHVTSAPDGLCPNHRGKR